MVDGFFKLTTQQRKYYFAVVVPIVLAHYEKNQGEFLMDLANVIKADTTSDFICEFLKMWFNNGRSTSKLNIPSHQYLEMLTAEFAKRGVDIPAPNEISVETLGELYRQYEERNKREKF